ncbi:hypothetical protein D3C87_2189380 [compost metagenome]
MRFGSRFATGGMPMHPYQGAYKTASGFCAEKFSVGNGDEVRFLTANLETETDG